MRPKVALVTSGVGTAQGGIGVVAELIVSALQKDSDVSIWRHSTSLPRIPRIGLAYARALLGSMKRPDLVIYDHIHLAVLHGVIPSLTRIPYVVFLHGVEVWEPLIGRRREALLNAKLLVANSATTELAARAANPWLPKIEIVWLGVPKQPRRLPSASSLPVALMVGRMASTERLKGHDPVLNAWPEIRASVPNANLIIVGTGDDEARLRRRVRDEGLESVTFCGRLNNRERDRLYASARLLFLPSKQEGFGIAAVEAAGFGVPVVGLAGTVIEELFPNGTGVQLASDWESHSMAQAAIPLLTDDRLARTLGQAAYLRVQDTFLEEHFSERFRCTLSKVLPEYTSHSEQFAAKSL